MKGETVKEYGPMEEELGNALASIRSAQVLLSHVFDELTPIKCELEKTHGAEQLKIITMQASGAWVSLLHLEFNIDSLLDYQTSKDSQNLPIKLHKK